MELIRINEQKLKIMLTASDMSAYDFDPDTIGENSAQTGHAFRLLLADIRRQIPFETEDRQLTVQYFPSRGGGCEMFISSVPFCGERKKQSEQRGGALTVRAGRQSPAVFRRDGAYRFETLDCLLRACRRLRDAGFAGERRSDGVHERRRVKPHEKDIICFSEVRVEPSHPRKRLVASRSVASAFTSEQQRRSATFFGEETQRNERAGDFY